ncbi:hypothetical protein RV17_GL001669 [Enterococcus thailandicus]|nr:hypothetical protein RV17_GL001669 [Enterococcus thailandicus]
MTDYFLFNEYIFFAFNKASLGFISFVNVYFMEEQSYYLSAHCCFLFRK